MKFRRDDILVISIIVITGMVFLVSPVARDAYLYFSLHYPFTAGFFKFAILATFGECLAQRFLFASFKPKNFAIIPKFFVWGFLGIFTTAAFAIYYNGVPQMLAASGLSWAPQVLLAGLSLKKILVAFITSFCMNIMFAPVLMVSHKIADMYIKICRSQKSGKTDTISISGLLEKLDWKTMWNFVLCKTVLFFWIPAHTCVFLLPSAYRVLTAAILGAVLGLVLAFAANKKHESDPAEILL